MKPTTLNFFARVEMSEDGLFRAYIRDIHSRFAETKWWYSTREAELELETMLNRQWYPDTVKLNFTYETQ